MSVISHLCGKKARPMRLEAGSCCWEICAHCWASRASTGLRLLNRYDVEGVSDELFRPVHAAMVFSEPQVDEHL